MKIAVSVPGRGATGGVCAGQWAFASALRMRGVEVRCLVPTARWIELLNRLLPASLRDFLIEARAPIQAKAFGPSLVLTPDWFALWHGRRRGIPIFHGGYGMTLRHSPPRTFLGKAKTSLLWWLQRRAAARAPLFIAVSREAMRMFGLPNGRVLLNGMDMDRLRPPSPAEKSAAKQSQGLEGDVVMMAGRWSPEKRLENVLELPRRQGRLYLICIPDKAEAGRFAERCAERGDIVVRTFPGGIPEEVWSATDLVYMPSRYEGCSLVWIEAAARGIPVVGTKVGHLIELTEEHPELADILLERNDLGPAAAKIEAALARRGHWGAVMRMLAEEHHDLRKIGAQLEALLLEAKSLS